MEPVIRLFFREPDIDTNAPIARGLVTVNGFKTQIVSRLQDADAWDCAFAARMLDFGAEPANISIPAFPNRKFRLSYIFVNASARISTPQDLHGKRVGVRFWGNTAGVWVRGALQHHYGVDLARICWVVGRHDGTSIPAGALPIEYLSDSGRSANLEHMLLSGEIDALIDANVPASITRRDPRVHRLFPHYMEEEKRFFQSTGIFPISHIVTLRKEFVGRHPQAPLALLEAFRTARDKAFDTIEGSDPQVLVLSWLSHFLDEQRSLMGPNYFAYDVEHNRNTLEAMTRFAREQWLTPRQIRVEELFDESTLAASDTAQ